MLAWLRKGLDPSRGGMVAVLGPIEEVFAPGAAQARELLEEQSERVVAVPSPGDRLLDEGMVDLREPWSRPDDA